MDNNGDGRIDEDPKNPVDGSAGEILVYDPDLEPLRDEQGNICRIDISSLPCVVHNKTDGLHANLDGVYHGVLVRVPVSFVQKAELSLCDSGMGQPCPPSQRPPS